MMLFNGIHFNIKTYRVKGIFFSQQLVKLDDINCGFGSSISLFSPFFNPSVPYKAGLL